MADLAIKRAPETDMRLRKAMPLPAPELFNPVKKSNVHDHSRLPDRQAVATNLCMNNQSDLGADPEKTTGWRGSRDVWLVAAKQSLIETGLDAVRIQLLSERLNLSRTSFYWFFKDRNELLDALLNDWQARNTGAFEEACEAYAETITEAVLNLITIFQDGQGFEPRLDFAIRGWAHQADAVMMRVNAEDERRLGAIRRMFERFGYAADDADVRARTVYLVQIGYISMQVQESTATRMARVPRYVEIYSGRSPTASEMARFFARLKFVPPGHWVAGAPLSGSEAAASVIDVA
jgi:AcrR family transcriptional regulator